MGWGMEVLSIRNSKLYKDVPRVDRSGVEDDEMTMTRGGWVANTVGVTDGVGTIDLWIVCLSSSPCDSPLSLRRSNKYSTGSIIEVIYTYLAGLSTQNIVDHAREDR